MLSLALSESGGELVQKPVVQWDNADVMDWLSGLGDWATDQNISRVFLREVCRLWTHKIALSFFSSS